MEGKSPTLLTDDLLGQLEARWRQQGAPVAGALRPGLSDEEIDDATGAIGLRLPREARRWWGWHDGADPPAPGLAPAQLGPGKNFLSLADAVKECERTRQVQRQAWGDDLGPHWQAGWLPLFSSNRPIVFDCSGSDVQPVPVRSFFFEDPTAGEEGVGSIGELVLVWIEAIDCGAWRYDQSAGRWLYDWKKLDPRVALLHLT
jgi:cell wall assembly regulator SMI1